MIITGGVNVYPAEIEGLLVTHPKVADVAVFGIPNEEFGEEVKAVVQLMDHNDASTETAEDLTLWMKERLAHSRCRGQLISWSSCREWITESSTSAT